MLAAVRWSAVALGVGAGLLTATALGLAVAAVLTALSVGDGPSIGLVTGVMAGLLAGGYAAGRMAPVSARFHGSLAGMGMAVVVVVVARLGGSPAPSGPVLLLAALAIVLGGLGGVAGGRR